MISIGTVLSIVRQRYQDWQQSRERLLVRRDELAHYTGMDPYDYTAVDAQSVRESVTQRLSRRDLLRAARSQYRHASVVAVLCGLVVAINAARTVLDVGMSIHWTKLLLAETAAQLPRIVDVLGLIVVAGAFAGLCGGCLRVIVGEAHRGRRARVPWIGLMVAILAITSHLYLDGAPTMATLVLGISVYALTVIGAHRTDVHILNTTYAEQRLLSLKYSGLGRDRTSFDYCPVDEPVEEHRSWRSTDAPQRYWSAP